MTDNNDLVIQESDILSYMKVHAAMIRLVWNNKEIISNAAMTPDIQQDVKSNVEKKVSSKNKDYAPFKEKVLYHPESILDGNLLAEHLGIRPNYISVWRKQGISIPFHKEGLKYFYKFREIKHLINEYGVPLHGKGKTPPIENEPKRKILTLKKNKKK